LSCTAGVLAARMKSFEAIEFLREDFVAMPTKENDMILMLKRTYLRLLTVRGLILPLLLVTGYVVCSPFNEK
jgi:hypothetical protein